MPWSPSRLALPQSSVPLRVVFHSPGSAVGFSSAGSSVDCAHTTTPKKNPDLLSSVPHLAVIGRKDKYDLYCIAFLSLVSLCLVAIVIHLLISLTCSLFYPSFNLCTLFLCSHLYMVWFTVLLQFSSVPVFCLFSFNKYHFVSRSSSLLVVD